LSKKICAQGERSEDGTGHFQINLAQIPAVTIQKIAEALSWNLWPDAAPQPGAAAKKPKTVDKGSKTECQLFVNIVATSGGKCQRKSLCKCKYESVGSVC
jgi:hypothetical protein